MTTSASTLPLRRSCMRRYWKKRRYLTPTTFRSQRTSTIHSQQPSTISQSKCWNKSVRKSCNPKKLRRHSSPRSWTSTMRTGTFQSLRGGNFASKSNKKHSTKKCSAALRKSTITSCGSRTKTGQSSSSILCTLAACGKRQ